MLPNALERVHSSNHSLRPTIRTPSGLRGADLTCVCARVRVRVCVLLSGRVSEVFITDFRFFADRKDKITAIPSSFSHSESLANSLCRFSQGNNGSTVVSI